MARITIYELGQHPNETGHENDLTLSFPLLKPSTSSASDEETPDSGEPTPAPEATPAERDSTDGSPGSGS